MEMALNEKPSSLQMENTYIPELPDGKGWSKNNFVLKSNPFQTMSYTLNRRKHLLLHINNSNIVEEM